MTHVESVMHAKTDKAMIGLYKELLAAWNERNARGMASLYAAQGSQVGFDGSVANGRDEIEAHLAPIFAGHPTPAYVGKVREVRDLGPDAALLRAVAGMIPPGSRDLNPDANTIQSLVASRNKEGLWRIELFHNTPAAFHGRQAERDKLTQELRALARDAHRAS
jgi:uncharacterized protein (TIGR02246 family)